MKKSRGEALIKEAKKRGYKKGVSVRPVPYAHNIWEISDNNYHYWEDTDRLQIGTDTIYQEGKWATIVETITKEEAEKQLGKTIIN